MADKRLDKRSMARAGIYVPDLETVYAGFHLYVCPKVLGGTRGVLAYSDAGEPYTDYLNAQVHYDSDIPPLSVEGALHVGEEMIRMAFRQLELRKKY